MRAAPFGPLLPTRGSKAPFHPQTSLSTYKQYWLGLGTRLSHTGPALPELHVPDRVLHNQTNITKCR